MICCYPYQGLVGNCRNGIAPISPKFDATNTVKPVLNGHTKIDKTNVLKTDGSLKQMESIAECSLKSIQGATRLVKSV